MSISNGGSKRVRVLIISEAEDTRGKLIGLLSPEPEFLLVGTAQNGKTGIDTAKAKSPDVILIDRDLRDADAADVVKAIHKVLPSAILILLSREDDSPWTREFLIAGADDFLTVPIQREELFTIIGMHWVGRQQ